MKPYFQEDGITIYHGDCREVLPSLEKDCADMILTDPPYGVNFQSGWNEKFGPIVGDHSEEIARIGVELMLRPLKDAKHLYIFGRMDLTGLPLSKPAELIWDKNNLGMGNLQIPWASSHEYIQFYVSLRRCRNHPTAGKLAARMRRGSVLKFPRINASALVHPSEKPVGLLRELIESSSCIGDTVLDGFAGAGSTLVAAQIEGRRAIGIEIEERYCEVAAKRLSPRLLEHCGLKEAGE